MHGRNHLLKRILIRRNNSVIVRMLLVALALMLFAAPIFAADGTAPAPIVTPGLAMAIASGLCALGQGKAIAASAEAIARNPGAFASIRFALIIGLVLIESLALYTLVIVLRS